jgi:RNA polymerase sigma factor (sigma-70 family)
MSAPSDGQLMLAVAGGDLSAFGQLVTRHRTTAWNTAYRFLGNVADAEDVAQEAFLKALDSARRYQPTASLRTCLCRIVSRLCFDLARRKRVRRHQPLPDLAADSRRPNALPSSVNRTRNLGGQFALAFSDLDVATVFNNTGVDLPRFGVAGLRPAIICPTDNLQEFKNRVNFYVSALAAFEGDAGRFAFLLEPIGAGKIGRAPVSGVCQVVVDVVNESHQRADAVYNQIG